MSSTPSPTVIIILCTSAIAIAYLLRVILSQAIIPLSAEYEWDQSTQGVILAAFFTGYGITQIAGGVISQRIGGKWVLAIGFLFSVIFTALLPLCAMSKDKNVVRDALIAFRFLTGVFQGVVFPSVTALLGVWIPSEMTASAVSQVWAGGFVGNALGMTGYPILTRAVDWSFPFYISGCLGIVWFMYWTFRVPNKKISSRVTINDENVPLLSHPKSKVDNPWLLIFRNASFWALVVNHCCYNWTFYILMVYLPKYFNHVIGLTFESGGLAILVPFVGLYISSTIAGRISDWLIYQKDYKKITVRKTVQTVGFLVPATIYLLMGLFAKDSMSRLVCVIIALSISGMSVSSFAVMPLDLSPRYSGAIVGISNTFATVPGFVGPILAGHLLDIGGCTDSYPEPMSCIQQWNNVFFISCGMYLFGAIVWLTFASTDGIHEDEE